MILTQPDPLIVSLFPNGKSIGPSRTFVDRLAERFTLSPGVRGRQMEWQFARATNRRSMVVLPIGVCPARPGVPLVLLRGLLRGVVDLRPASVRVL